MLPVIGTTLTGLQLLQLLRGWPWNAMTADAHQPQHTQPYSAYPTFCNLFVAMMSCARPQVPVSAGADCREATRNRAWATSVGISWPRKEENDE